MTDTIPKDWETRNLGSIAKIDKGITYKSSDYSDQQNGLPFLTLKSILKGGGYSERGIKYYKGEYQADHVLTFGDLLLANTDLTRDGDVVGSTIFFDGLGFDRPTIYSMDLTKLSVDSDIANSKFLYYLLNTAGPKRFFVNSSAGSTVLHLNRSRIPKLQLSLPPIVEQEKIADILTSVDDTIEHTQAQVAKLQDLKTATMNELLTRGIGHTEFRESELGLIPTTWEIKELGELTEKIGSGVTPRGGSSVYIERGPILIRSQNVLVGRLDLNDVAHIPEEIHSSMEASQLLAKDCLLNITGASIGRSAVVPKNIGEANVNQHVCIVRPSPRLLSDYLCQFFNSSLGQLMINTFQAGGNREGLNFQQISQMRIGLPSIAEQEKIADILTSLDDQIEAIESKLVQLESLKKSLMGDLLTGRVRVLVD